MFSNNVTEPLSSTVNLVSWVRVEVVTRLVLMCEWVVKFTAMKSNTPQTATVSRYSYSMLSHDNHCERSCQAYDLREKNRRIPLPLCVCVKKICIYNIFFFFFFLVRDVTCFDNCNGSYTNVRTQSQWSTRTLLVRGATQTSRLTFWVSCDCHRVQALTLQAINEDHVDKPAKLVTVSRQSSTDTPLQVATLLTLF